MPGILREMMSAGFPWIQDWDYQNTEQLQIEYNKHILPKAVFK